MKDIKDYLHLYRGCEIQINYGDGQGIDVFDCLTASEAEPGKYIVITESFTEHYIEDVKPILRPLSDMTNDDRIELNRNLAGIEKFTIDGERMKWMLSKGFDVFGLIESGLAIDVTQVSK